MNGELLIKGYKFPKTCILNFQDRTVITGDDTFTIFELFNMLENYFCKKDFSDYYLDKGTLLILNGNVLSGDEFIVFRLSPMVSLAEELKITKKSILGQVVSSLFEDKDERTVALSEAIETNILKYINPLTKAFGISFVSETEDIFTISKIIKPSVEHNKKDILFKENNQFHNKSFLINLISKVKTNKKKLLLVELPEYGLKDKELQDFLQILVKASIDNIVIYTNRVEVTKTIPDIYNYNISKKGELHGFDDYDELESKLRLLIYNENVDIVGRIFDYIFSLSSGIKLENDSFTRIIEEFYQKNY